MNPIPVAVLGGAAVLAVAPLRRRALAAASASVAGAAQIVGATAIATTNVVRALAVGPNDSTRTSLPDPGIDGESG